MQPAKHLLLLLLLTTPSLLTAKPPSIEDKSKSSAREQYTGYTVDGRTSASVLAAQRSHSIAGKDETNFAIYSGATVICMILIFAHFLSNKK